VDFVVFLALLDTLTTGSFSLSHFEILFIQDAVGGILMGLLLDYSLHVLLKSIDIKSFSEGLLFAKENLIVCPIVRA
jgi:NhaP-type Na+/H+ or K+/H+ antiporter